MAENGSKVIGFIKGGIAMIDKYGTLKIVFASLLMLFISFITYLTLNPSFVFERYSEYEEKKHIESFNYRMESTPIVQSLTNNMVIESKALRCFIIEMHNGKYNASGLSFNYGALTYEGLRENVESVQEDYNDFTLDRYPILSYVYKNGKWSGNIDELKKIDKRMALKLESNGAYYLSISMIYGTKNDIGFIGASFDKNDSFDKNKVEMLLNKYSSRVSPYLDGERAKK